MALFLPFFNLPQFEILAHKLTRSEISAVCAYNPYIQAALEHLKSIGEVVLEEDEARLSPLSYGHVNMLGHYSFTLAEQVTKDKLRPLKKQPIDSEEFA